MRGKIRQTMLPIRRCGRCGAGTVPRRACASRGGHVVRKDLQRVELRAGALEVVSAARVALAHERAEARRRAPRCRLVRAAPGLRCRFAAAP